MFSISELPPISKTDANFQNCFKLPVSIGIQATLHTPCIQCYFLAGKSCYIDDH